MKRRPRNPFAGLLTHLSLLGSLGVLAVTMAANGDGGGNAGEPPAGDPPASDPPAGDPPPSGDDKPAMLSLSQADLDKMIDKAVGKKASAKDAEFKKWLEAQSLSEADQAKVAREAAEQERDQARQEALTVRVETSIERAALAAGVAPGRVDRFLKLVDLDIDTLTADGKPDSDAIAAAVKAALEDVPEFAGSSAEGDGKNGTKPKGSSGGQHNGGGAPQTFTREQIDKMSAKEFAENEKAIDAAMKAGLVK